MNERLVEVLLSDHYELRHLPEQGEELRYYWVRNAAKFLTDFNQTFDLKLRTIKDIMNHLRPLGWCVNGVLSSEKELGFIAFRPQNKMYAYIGLSDVGEDSRITEPK